MHHNLGAIFTLFAMNIDRNQDGRGTSAALRNNGTLIAC